MVRPLWLLARHSNIMRTAVGPVRLRTPRVPWGEVREFERTIKGQLSKCSYREKPEDLIRQYTGTLDSRDWNGDFIRLWGVLACVLIMEGFAMALLSIAKPLNRRHRRGQAAFLRAG